MLGLQSAYGERVTMRGLRPSYLSDLKSCLF